MAKKTTFDLWGFLDYVYPSIKEQLSDIGLVLDKEFNVSDGGTIKYEPQIMYTDDSVSIQYFDENEKTIGDILFNLELQEYTYDFPNWEEMGGSKYNDGGAIDKKKQTYEKWKDLVNMSKGELEKFYNSKEGKAAGISSDTAKELGISRGRTSAKWIMKMKETPHTKWTPEMWKWANKQISFISRMKGNKGDLYDDKGNKTRKHTSLLIWGHNPNKRYEGGGKLKIDNKEVTQEEFIKIYQSQSHSNFFNLKSKKIEYNGNDRQLKEAVEDYNREISPYFINGKLKENYMKAIILDAFDKFTFRKFGDAYRKNINNYFSAENNSTFLKKGYTWKDKASYIVADSYYNNENEFRGFAKDLGITIPPNNPDIRYGDGGSVEVDATANEDALPISELNKMPKGGTNQDIYAPDYYNKLKNSIKDEGMKEPIVLRYYVEDNVLRVQDGHHRLKIANELGLKDVPVKVNVVWGRSIKQGNEDIQGQELYHPPKPLDVEGYSKRNYAPSNIELSELGYAAKSQSIKETTKDVKSFYTWFCNWYKGVCDKIDIMISLPNAISGLKAIPYEGDNVVILDMFRKKDQSIDAKPYLETILNKADEYKINIYLLPDPNYKYIDDIQYRKKISTKYLIDYYNDFGFELTPDKEFMKRVCKYTKGGKVVVGQKDFLKFNKIGIKNKYTIEAIGDIGLNKVKFTNSDIEKAIENEFDKLLGSFKNYIINEDSNAITKTIQAEIDARKNQGDSLGNISNYELMLHDKSERKRYIDDFAKNQLQTIAEWVAYLAKSEYNVSFKYLILKAVLLYNYDFKIDKLIERSNKTIRNFTPFDAATLGEVYVMQSDYLLKDYTNAQNENVANILASKEIVKSSGDGRWIKFNGGSSVSKDEILKNSKELSQLVQNTYWCTKTNSHSQLEGGDFYVYVTELNGDVFPRIAIRMEEDKVGEVRGNKSASQDLETDMLPIAENFLVNNIPNNSGVKWLENIRYNNSVVSFTESIKNNPLTESDYLKYLDIKSNEIKYLVEYARSNGNVDNLQSLIRQKVESKDLDAKTIKYSDFVFDVNDIDKKSKHFFGNADFRDSVISDLGNLTTIRGNADFEGSNITSLGNLTTIGGDADFRDSDISDLGNLTTIGGDADFGASGISDLGNLTTIGRNADFKGSNITSLGNLTTIGRNADFRYSVIADLGNLTTIGGNAIFDNDVLKVQWLNIRNKEKSMLEGGGKLLTLNLKNNKMSNIKYNQLPHIEKLENGKNIMLMEDVFVGATESPKHIGARFAKVEVMGKGGIAKTLNLKVIDSWGVNPFSKHSIINRPIKNLMNKGRDLGTNVAQSIKDSFKQGGELNPDDKKTKDYIEHKSGDAGGLLVGKRHSEGGIKAINNGTGDKIEMEGGEVVITRNAVSDTDLHEFEGKKMTNREILSSINESGGGVSFAEGGENMSCRCMGKKYKYGGEEMTDFDIANSIKNKHISQETIKKGMDIEDKEHGETFKMLKDGKMTYQDFLKRIVSDHLKENAKYYDKQ